MNLVDRIKEIERRIQTMTRLLMNARRTYTIGAHHTQHEPGGSDPVIIKLDDAATPDDNTDLNASALRHGLLQRLDGSTDNFQRGDGVWAIPPGGSSTGGLRAILDEAFDALVTGAISGQGVYAFFAAWAVILNGTSTAEVVDFGAGDKGVRLIGDAGAASSYAYLVASAGLPLDLSHGVRLRFRMRTDDVSMGSKGVAIGTGTATPLCQVYFLFSATDQLAFWSGAAITKLIDCADNTWYVIDIVIFKTSATAAFAMIWIDGVYIKTVACGTHAAGAPWIYFQVYDNSSAAGSDSRIDVSYAKIGHAFIFP